jgi:spermidine synthase
MSKCPFSSMLGLPLLTALAGLTAVFATSIRKALVGPLEKPFWTDDAGNLWFSEISEFWPNQQFAIRVERILFRDKSEFQEIIIFDSVFYGRVLVLDGAIQVTTLDEASYQEMMVHTPMQLLPAGSAKRVLVIGGGDGGVLRELAKYPEIEAMQICEIDAMVIQKSKEFLPQLSVGYSDPRVTEHVYDGIKFIEEAIERGEFFDVIISDLSDPIGPAGSIYNGNFVELLSKALDPDHGVACLQGESYWLHDDLIRKLTAQARDAFPKSQYASIAIPTYPNGQIGAIIMAKNAEVDVEVPVRSLPEGATFRWYTHKVHAAQFALPIMVQDLVYGVEL